MKVKRGKSKDSREKYGFQEESKDYWKKYGLQEKVRFQEKIWILGRK